MGPFRLERAHFFELFAYSARAGGNFGSGSPYSIYKGPVARSVRNQVGFIPFTGDNAMQGE